jgi:DNA-binding PadR family transcriptional regulator
MPDHSIRPYTCPTVLGTMPRMMHSFSAGDTTPQMIVLGLVIQQQDTASGVARRLADQFASARFSKSTAYNRLPGLAEKGYLRLVEGGVETSLVCYEATSEGIEFFREWLRSTELPPVVRDALQCKLELLGPEDLVSLVQIVREEERVYTAAFKAAQLRVKTEQRLRRARVKLVDWRTRVRGVQRKDEAKLWGLMSMRLQSLGDELEELLDELSVDGS